MTFARDAVAACRRSNSSKLRRSKNCTTVVTLSILVLVSTFVIVLNTCTTFVFGSGGVLRATTSVSKPRGYNRGEGTSGQEALVSEDVSAIPSPSWTSFISVAIACGFVAQLAGASPAQALSVEDLLTPPMPRERPVLVAADAEEVAKEARLALEESRLDVKVKGKESRLQEKLAIRMMVAEKVKAEEVITSNFRAELDKISADRKFEEQAASDRVKEARDRVIESSKNAEAFSEEKRKLKVVRDEFIQPAKKVLTTALAEKSIAEQEAAGKKAIADEAMVKFEAAEKMAELKKAEVEKAVIDLAATGTA